MMVERRILDSPGNGVVVIVRRHDIVRRLSIDVRLNFVNLLDRVVVVIVVVVAIR